MSTIIIDNPNYRVVTGAPDPDDPDYNDWADKFRDLDRPEPEPSEEEEDEEEDDGFDPANGFDPTPGFVAVEYE